MTHIFLTGQIQVGKSTLLRKVLTGLSSVRVGGFRTVTASDLDGALGSVYLVPAALDPPLFSEADRVAIRFGGNRGAVGYPEVFDRAGIAALRDAEKADLIVMDEIGFLEADAAGFRVRIGDLLDGDTPILGVVRQQGETAQQRMIRMHPKVRVIEVTKENRDSLYPEILAFFMSKLKHTGGGYEESEVQIL